MSIDSKLAPASGTGVCGGGFVKELDFTPDELRALIDLYAEITCARNVGRGEKRGQGRDVVLVFEKTSTRTRCAFEVAAYDQGAHLSYLGPDSSQIGQKETIKNTARAPG